jgi:EAL domain-containing protein (putative c-di-GMP-specific phosphodiesterase class I)/cellobiose-specific phosphotransferase system component IIC
MSTWFQNKLIYQLNNSQVLLFNHRIIKAVVASSLAIVPFAIIRALILVSSIIASHMGWQQSSAHLLQLEETLTEFMPIVMNAFMALHWAIRNRYSVIHFLTINLCSLLFISRVMSDDKFFFFDNTVPLALLSGIIVNLLLDNSIRFVDKLQFQKNKSHKASILFLFSVLIISFSTFIIGVVAHNFYLWAFPFVSQGILSSYPDNFIDGLLYIVFRCIPWFFGIHGYFVFADLDIGFISAMEGNISAWHAGQAQLNIISPVFYNIWCTMGGTGNTLGMLLCIALNRKSPHRHTLGLSLPLSLFNVNEPLIFGLPIVMNPLLIIPFVLVPAVSYTIAYTATAWHLVPPVSEAVNWSVPPILSTWIATGGSVSAIVLNIVIIGVSALIYTPFVRKWSISKQKTQDLDLFLPPTNLDLVPGHYLQSEEKSYLDALNQVQRLQTSGHFILYFQPQVRISDRRIIGVEALIRHQGVDGKITPPVFLQYYDRLKAMADIDFWVIKRSVNYLHQQLGCFDDMTLSVNVSAQTLLDKRLLTVISQVLEKPLPQGWNLEIEITESQAVIDPEGVISVLMQLKSLGIRIALDDFGAGYSTLNYLTRYPLDKIKLDRSLVQGLSEKGGLQFLKQITRLCRLTQCNLVIEGVETEDELRQVLIEGVETDQELAQVRSAGIELAQGYLFWRPLAVDNLCLVLKENHLRREPVQGIKAEVLSH